MFIRTERLFLRPGWPDDLDQFVKLLNDEPVARNLSARPLPSNVDAAREIISRPRDPHLPHFFINQRNDEGLTLIGSIGLGQAGDDVELGYWLARAHWGQGLASEAVAAVLQHAWILGHPRIVAMHFADNSANDRVLTHAGFRPTGETRDRFSYHRGCKVPAMVYVIDRPATPSLEPISSGETAWDDRAA